MRTDSSSNTLSQKQFADVRERLYKLAGIKLSSGKEALVAARLAKRMRHLNLDSYEQYMSFVAEDRTGRELAQMIDVLTTNKTSFFRESQHFDFLREQMLPKLGSGANRPVRIWSAGCSNGKEPYTIAMLMRETTSDVDKRDWRILATDISERMLTVAREGIYDEGTAAEIPPTLLKKYFTSVVCTDARTDMSRRYQVSDNVRSMVSFARLNLMEEWPMKGLFNAIFCRNVMIYFDKPTQQRLVQRYWEMLAPGGHLFIGHSESLTNIAGKFRYVQPALYVK